VGYPIPKGNLKMKHSKKPRDGHPPFTDGWPPFELAFAVVHSIVACCNRGNIFSSISGAISTLHFFPSFHLSKKTTQTILHYKFIRLVKYLDHVWHKTGNLETPN
jgi:hypothetical protein